MPPRLRAALLAAGHCRAPTPPSRLRRSTGPRSATVSRRQLGLDLRQRAGSLSGGQRAQLLPVDPPRPPGRRRRPARTRSTSRPSELAASGRLPPERLSRLTRLTRRVGARATGRMTDPQPFDPRGRAGRVQGPLHPTGRRDPRPPASHGSDEAPAHASMAPHRDIHTAGCHQSAPRPLEAVIPCCNHDRVPFGAR
jgi:hypothetical protein